MARTHQPRAPEQLAASESRLPDLTPARWIWYPSGRTLPNTFVLFRRELDLPAPPRRATGWIAADSRYRLEVNGARVQWGPAPADPRWPEADPVDLTALLARGRNVLGATVLFYGLGEGTWPLGKPGFLFWLEIEHADGRHEVVVSDASWQAHLSQAWRPGQHKRWYLRALQEVFDARQHPHGWSRPEFAPGNDWLPAMELTGSPNRPALATDYPEFLHDLGEPPASAQLRPRSIPLLRESIEERMELRECHTIEWRRPPEEYFAMRPPDCYRATPRPLPARHGREGTLRFALDGRHGMALTFALPQQIVGWPGFTIRAPAGTVVELLVHEAHAPGGPALLNTHFDSWTRFVCDGGEREFETFDFESLRWLQLHVHGPRGTVTIRGVRVRRRVFPWRHAPTLRTSEGPLQRLFDAALNTLDNCAQETLVDGMARERQQYSGDGGHQLHAVHLARGEPRLVARYLATWSQGLTKDGYFLDCWPAHDRLARLVERQLDLTPWGPILDHGVGFIFDCWHHWQYTGDCAALAEPFPRLLRFARFLRGLAGPDGLLPVENLGVPSVWMDHAAYREQRHKQCAFNLYVAAALQHALVPLCRALGDGPAASEIAVFARHLERRTVRRFWSRRYGLFVNNLPWLAEEGAPRLCDRSLATAVLFAQCPGGNSDAALRALAECPPEMGISYPCNAGWRLWALAHGGRADVVLHDLRTRWARMTSVRENNTLQEDWEARHDSGQQWSHCAVAPLYLAYHAFMGLRPLAPGFARLELRPQLADLADLELTAHTVRGPVRFGAKRRGRHHRVAIEIPAGCAGEIVLPRAAAQGLTALAGGAPPGHGRYRLPSGRIVRLRL